MQNYRTAVDFSEGTDDERTDGEREEIDTQCKSKNGGVRDIIMYRDAGKTWGHHRASKRPGGIKVALSKVIVCVFKINHSRYKCIQSDHGRYTPLCSYRPVAWVA